MTSNDRAPPLASASPAPAPRSSTTRWRASLVGAVLVTWVVTCVVATMRGVHADAAFVDPDLATLLHGMAILKAAATLGAMAVLWWRFERPIAPRIALAGLLAIGLMAGASVLIWHLDHLLPAAIAFHAGLFALPWLALRDEADGIVRSSAMVRRYRHAFVRSEAS